jgi:Urocanase Rossmann-like domain
MNDRASNFGLTASLDIADVFERYLSLRRLAESKYQGELGGRLVLFGQMDDRGSAIALAASIAGAASLGVSSDPEVLKLAIRNGVCDFMVNTLDEALRILKNEVRKRLPVAVGLQQGFPAAVAEIVERGVQPDILAWTAEEAAASSVQYARLVERGSSVLEDASSSEPAGRAGVWWSVASNPAQALPKLDGIAMGVLGDEVRGRWLRLAPRYLGRRAKSIRYVAMTDGEAEAFVREIEKTAVEKQIESGVSVRFRDREVRVPIGES